MAPEMYDDAPHGELQGIVDHAERTTYDEPFEFGGDDDYDWSD